MNSNYQDVQLIKSFYLKSIWKVFAPLLIENYVAYATYRVWDLSFKTPTSTRI